MITWILIVAVYFSGGVALTSVPGFSSMAECNAAAKATGTLENEKLGYGGTTRAICVKQTESIPTPEIDTSEVPHPMKPLPNRRKP